MPKQVTDLSKSFQTQGQLLSSLVLETQLGQFSQEWSGSSHPRSTSLLLLRGPISAVLRERRPRGRTIRLDPVIAGFQFQLHTSWVLWLPRAIISLSGKLAGLPCRDVMKTKRDNVQKASHVVPRSRKCSGTVFPFPALTLGCCAVAAGAGGAWGGRQGES